MSAKFYDHDVKSGLADKRKLSAYLDKLAGMHLKNVKKLILNYIFCNDAFLLEINKKYLKHNTLTDIITFDLSESETTLEGEIYISVERVRENAVKFETIYIDELHRVIFHGALHLCGFKDKQETDKELMRKMENKCLEEYKHL